MLYQNLLLFSCFILVYGLFARRIDKTVISGPILALIRMLPVYFSLIKTGLPLKDKLFIGWFGPRGLATIVFAIIVLDVPLPHQRTIIITTVCVILASVVLHGFTANPFIKLLNKK